MDVFAIVTSKDLRVVAMIEKFSLEPYGWNLLALGREMVRMYPDCMVSMTTHNYKIGDKFNPKHNDGWGYLFQ